MGALVLTRREGQSIVIGDKIKVTVTHVRTGQVRLVVSAPAEVAVDREEVRVRKGNDCPGMRTWCVTDDSNPPHSVTVVAPNEHRAIAQVARETFGLEAELVGDGVVS